MFLDKLLVSISTPEVVRFASRLGGRSGVNGWSHLSKHRGRSTDDHTRSGVRQEIRKITRGWGGNWCTLCHATYWFVGSFLVAEYLFHFISYRLYTRPISHDYRIMANIARDSLDPGRGISLLTCKQNFWPGCQFVPESCFPSIASQQPMHWLDV